MVSLVIAVVKILLVDSNPLLREGLKRILETNNYFQVIAEGDSGGDLLPLYKRHQPDLVIMDTHFPAKNGIEALHELRCLYPDSRVLMFTSSTNSVNLIESFKCGAAGYMLKEMDISSILNAVKITIKGEVYLHPKVTGCFISEFNKLRKFEDNHGFYQMEVRRPFHLMTRRETEILQLLAEGNSNASMAEMLCLSDKTIKNHVSAILRKMGVKDRTQAVMSALKNGWVELK